MTYYYTKQGSRYKPVTEPLLTKEQAWGLQGLMAMAAHRYCMGRATYIVGCCADWLIAEWESLPENVRAIIQRDTEYEFIRDDEARERGDTYKPLGHDCDRREWERVRALWKGKT